MLPLSGFAADYFDRRKLLIATQAAMGTAGARPRHPDGLRASCGCGMCMCLRFCSAASARLMRPPRQTFVAELVGEEDLSNAVGLNSTSFNAARMIGPAIAGLLIAAVGTGWVFLINAAVVRRRALLAVLAARRATAPADRAPARDARRASSRACATSGGGPTQGDPADAVPDRHIRHQLPDLHLDHVGRRLPRGGGRIRLAVLDAGDRLGGGRAALRPARESPAWR